MRKVLKVPEPDDAHPQESDESVDWDSSLGRMERFTMSSLSEASSPTMVLIADGQYLFSEALAAALGRHEDLAIVQEHPATGPDAYQAALHYRPDVMLMDYWMPDTEGPACTRMVLSAVPGCKVVLLSWFHGRKEIEETFAAGAAGFLPKSSTVDEVVKAIRQARDFRPGKKHAFEEDVKRLVGKLDVRSQLTDELVAGLSSLTPREVQILSLLNRGYKKEQIARQLVVSTQTVQTHIRNILKKAGGRPQNEILFYARRLGLIRI